MPVVLSTNVMTEPIPNRVGSGAIAPIMAVRCDHCTAIEKEVVMKRMKVLLPVFAIVLAMLLSACGGGSPGSSSSPSPTATSTPSPTPTPVPQAAHTGQSADQILQGLKAKGLPIGAVTTYTAASDPNHLLGRPGQYTDKVSFKD